MRKWRICETLRQRLFTNFSIFAQVNASLIGIKANFCISYQEICTLIIPTLSVLMRGGTIYFSIRHSTQNQYSTQWVNVHFHAHHDKTPLICNKEHYRQFGDYFWVVHSRAWRKVTPFYINVFVLHFASGACKWLKAILNRPLLLLLQYIE